LIDITGNPVIDSLALKSSNNLRFEADFVHRLNPGVYFICLDFDGKRVQQKIVIF